MIEAGLWHEYKVLTNLIFIKLKVKKETCPKCRGSGEHRYRYMGNQVKACDRCRGMGGIGDWEDATIPGVTKIDSVAHLYKTSAQIMEKDTEQPIMVIVDELQNSAHAYGGTGGMHKTLTIMQGDARKFNHTTIFATPIYSGVPSGIRQYAEFRFFKSHEQTKMYNDIKERNYTKKQMIFVECDYLGSSILPFDVPVTRYNKAWLDLKPGNTVYDHKASALLWKGEVGGKEFDLDEFGLCYRNKKSKDIPQLVLSWFDEQEEEGGQDGNVSFKVLHPINDVGSYLHEVHKNTDHIVLMKIEGVTELQEVKLTAENLRRLLKNTSSSSMSRAMERWSEEDILGRRDEA